MSCSQVEKEEQAKREQEQLASLGTGKVVEDQWGDAAATEWTTEGTGIGVATQQPTPAFAGTTSGGEDWNVGPTTATKDWAADDAGDWGNAEPKVCGHCCLLTVLMVSLLCRQPLGTGRHQQSLDLVFSFFTLF